MREQSRQPAARSKGSHSTGRFGMPVDWDLEIHEGPRRVERRQAGQKRTLDTAFQLANKVGLVGPRNNHSHLRPILRWQEGL